MPPWLLWIAGKVLPARIFGLDTAVLLKGWSKIKAVVDLLEEAGAKPDDAKKIAAEAVAKRPAEEPDEIARKAIEDRGLTWTP